MTRLLALALVLLLAPTARAAAPDEVNAAVEKGVAWLRSKQQADGSFACKWVGQQYKSGETALALLTLLKGGVEPGDPAIDRGFDWLLAQPMQKTYEVSVAILALEARYTPDDEASLASKDPLATQIRQRFGKVAPPRDRDWLARAVEFLVAHQDKTGLWKYPFYGDPDVSNAQFAVLALKAAVRMSVKVPKEAFLHCAEWLLANQEASGQDVPQFDVPAADQPIQGLLDRRAREKEKRRQRDQERAQAGGGTRSRDGAPPASDATRTRTPMKARGWAYKPGAAPRGSMTAAGLAILVVCKDELEDFPKYGEQLGPKVDQALRDGAAWVANRFQADKNPGAEPDWLFYWLYTLERAGTLLAVDRFGGRDWYAEGSAVILRSQQGDGRIVGTTSGESDGELAGTCLGLLFLKRSTVPVVKRVATGESLSGGAAGAPSSSATGPQVTKRPDGLFDVTLSFSIGAGKRVSLAGSMNGWSKDAALAEDPDGDGTYVVRLTLPAGRHTYKFVVDGSAWHVDPSNPRTESDGSGNSNSLLELN